MASRGTWVPIAALLALGGCGEMPFGLAGDVPSGLCAPIPVMRDTVAANSYQQAIQRDECVHRAAYLLARAPDPAEAVVGAVIAACRPQISRSATMLAGEDEAALPYYTQEMERVAREKALYRVIQARAGGCSGA